MEDRSLPWLMDHLADAWEGHVRHDHVHNAHAFDVIAR